MIDFHSNERVVTRRCTNKTTVKGIDIPVNISVAVDVLSLHFDKEIWGEDANEFNPSRFSLEIKRNPLAFMTFGQGPRNCIGKIRLMFKIIS